MKNKSGIIKKIAGILFFTGLLIIAYASYIYIRWNHQKNEIINKLFDYKKQLDLLRSPLPSEDKASEVTVHTVAIPSKVFDINNKLIGEFLSERRTLINLERLPGYVMESLIASEDRKFFEHEGINYVSIFRAVLKNLISFQYSQGGSTISQQLAKVLFTNQEKTMGRKIFELFCTMAIEERFTKPQIFEMYINLIYMGHGNYGIESASEFYFNKSSEFLTLAETTALIGLLPSPERYSPVNGLEKSITRMKTVLNALIETKKITQKQANSALKSYYQLWKVRKLNNEYSSIIGKFPDRAYKINLAPFFLDLVRQDLLKDYNQDEIMKGGMKIYTSLDYDRQKQAEIALKRAIEKQKSYFDELEAKAIKSGNSSRAEYYQDAKEKTNGAFITLDPKTGHILTMIGGSEFSAGNQFNRSTKALRQVGSLLKPFIYYLAIDKKKITPATIVKDEEVSIGGFDFHNYDNRYMGDVTIYEALKKSRNTIAVKTLEAIGVSPFRNLLESILNTDLSKRIPQEIGIALGTPVFTPMEVATMYSTLVNNGKSVSPKYLLRVEDSRNRVLWENKLTENFSQILKPEAAYIVVEMLQSIFKTGGTAGWVDEVKSKNKDILNFQIAGKTGTTSDHKDAWFAGLTSDEVSVVWVGSDLNAPLGDDKSGGSICSPVWVEYIQNSRNGNPPGDFKTNYSLTDITTENFCLDSGGVPKKEESCIRHENASFITGTEPDYFCPLHN